MYIHNYIPNDKFGCICKTIVAPQLLKNLGTWELVWSSHHRPHCLLVWGTAPWRNSTLLLSKMSLSSKTMSHPSLSFLARTVGWIAEMEMEHSVFSPPWFRREWRQREFFFLLFSSPSRCSSPRWYPLYPDSPWYTDTQGLSTSSCPGLTLSLLLSSISSSSSSSNQVHASFEN